MSQCPRCGTRDRLPNQFENVPFDQVAGGALAAKQAGRPVHALSALAIWVVVEAINYCRRAWKCPACGKTFS